MTSDASRRPQQSKSSPRARSERALGRTLLPLHGRRRSLARSAVGANLLLFAVTLVELVFLLRTTATLAIEDWIYVSQHVLVLAIALTRRPAVAQDQSWPTSLAVVVSYAYPYAQVIYLNSIDGYVAWPDGGIVLVIAAALLSLSALVSIGRLFGVRPALRGSRQPAHIGWFGIRCIWPISSPISDNCSRPGTSVSWSSRSPGGCRCSIASTPRSGCCRWIRNGPPMLARRHRLVPGLW